MCGRKNQDLSIYIGQGSDLPDVVEIFPNEAAIRRLVGAILMEQTKQWAVQRSRCMTLEILAPVGDDPLVTLPAAQGD